MLQGSVIYLVLALTSGGSGIGDLLYFGALIWTSQPGEFKVYAVKAWILL